MIILTKNRLQPIKRPIEHIKRVQIKLSNEMDHLLGEEKWDVFMTELSIIEYTRKQVWNSYMLRQIYDNFNQR